MKTGTITITHRVGSSPNVTVELVNGTVWLTKHQIAELFGVFAQSVEANLRAIFKAKIVDEKEVCYTHYYTQKGVEKQVTLYNLEVLIALGYRLSSPNAEIFRYFVTTALCEHLKKRSPQNHTDLVWIYRQNDAVPQA